MTRENTTAADTKLDHMMQLLGAREANEAPRQHSQRTPACPSLPRFKAARDANDWTDAERQHVFHSGCVYCGKVLGMFDVPNSRLAVVRSLFQPEIESSDAPAERSMCDEFAEGPGDLLATAAEPGGLAPVPVPSGRTVIGGSVLARSEASWPTLRERLRPWLPALLSLAGLNPTRGHEFLAFVERFIPIGKDQRLRQLLPQWLKQFGSDAVQLDELSDANLAWMAVRVVAGRAMAGESPTARQAREVVLARRDVTCYEEAVRVMADGVLPRLPMAYWVGFFSDVGSEERELATVL